MNLVFDDFFSVLLVLHVVFYHIYFSRQHPFTAYGRRMAHKFVDQFELLYTKDILDVVTLHHPDHFEVIQKNNGH